MIYNMKAHQTIYKGVSFRSRLEARWAAFFDLIGWEWEYEPFDLIGWTPDFLVSFHCGHMECGGKQSRHKLLVEVKPYTKIEQFDGHPCTMYPYGHFDASSLEDDVVIPADASAAFGNDPYISRWEMCHGAGGGIYTLMDWTDIEDIDVLWNKAGAKVQWKPNRKTP